jgi:hypothetical protein
MLLFAHLLNGNYDQANKVFSANLRGAVDLKVLERCASQIQRNQILNRTNYVKRVTNVHKFKPFAANNALKSEIISIIGKFFK